MTNATLNRMKLGKQVLLVACAAIVCGSCTDAGTKVSKFAALDPFRSINPASKHNPFAANSPLADAAVEKWRKELININPAEIKSEIQRNDLLYTLLFIADHQFYQYENDLLMGRATRDSFIELSSFGLTTATQFATTTRTAKLLSAIAGALGFSRSTLDKNFYSNHALPALVAKMKVLRKEKRNEILSHISKPLTEYPTTLALLEMLEYWNRGTVMGALNAITEDTALQDLRASGATVNLPQKAASMSSQIESGSLVVRTLERKQGVTRVSGTVNAEPDPPPRTPAASSAEPTLDSRKTTLKNKVSNVKDIEKLKKLASLVGASEPSDVTGTPSKPESWQKQINVTIDQLTTEQEVKDAENDAAASLN